MAKRHARAVTLVDVAGELEQLAYDVATRALAEQDAEIDEIRSRTGTLLAAVSLVASFLGGRALDASGFTWANLVAFTGIQHSYVQNSQVVRELVRAFRVACIALALEVAFWVAALGLH